MLVRMFWIDALSPFDGPSALVLIDRRCSRRPSCEASLVDLTVRPKRFRQGEAPLRRKEHHDANDDRSQPAGRRRSGSNRLLWVARVWQVPVKARTGLVA